MRRSRPTVSEPKKPACPAFLEPADAVFAGDGAAEFDCEVHGAEGGVNAFGFHGAIGVIDGAESTSKCRLPARGPHRRVPPATKSPL
jgi:hypothetical protein